VQQETELGLSAADMHLRGDALAEFGLRAIREPSFAGLLDEAARMVREILGTDFSKVLQLERDGSLRVMAGEGWPPGVVGEVEIPPEGDSQASHAMRTREPVIVEDLSTERRFQAAPVFLELGVRSGVNVVIEGGSRPFGVLEVDSRDARPYSSADVSFMQAVANVLSSVVARKLRDEEREQLLSLVSHELRNPLTIVLGFATQLTRGLPDVPGIDSRWVEAAQSVWAGAERMERTLSMLMQLGQVEGEITPQFTSLDLQELLTEVVAEARMRYPQIEFKEELLEAGASIVSDELWARAALSNIIGNAAKYSRLAPEVRVSVAATDGGFEVHVLDRCGGIAGQELDRLFERFFRGDSSDGTEGLGLGLYVAQRAARLLGWHIDVNNYPGVGCEFRVLVKTDSRTQNA
jgi:signal transduction histidine kinase